MRVSCEKNSENSLRNCYYIDMKVDGLFLLVCLIFLFVAWFATGGPSRPIASAGPWITPLTRSGEESQGYRTVAPANPVNRDAYPRVPSGSPSTISSGETNTRSGSGSVYIDRSMYGPASGNPNSEYVALVNASSSAVSVSGWRLSSKATGASITIPATSPIVSNGRTAIVSGRKSANDAYKDGSCAQSASACVYLDRNLEMYAASKETITLTNASGKVVDSFSY